MEEPYIWEGKAGEPSRKVKPYNMETRRTIDREAAERGIAFMERNVSENRPFFFFYPITQIHFPTLPHPDFDGTTGAGDIGDAMADVDHNVGLVLEALDRLDIAENTIVFWCTDNGAERRRPWRGSAGNHPYRPGPGERPRSDERRPTHVVFPAHPAVRSPALSRHRDDTERERRRHVDHHPVDLHQGLRSKESRRTALLFFGPYYPASSQARRDNGIVL
jgi:hypothetical protein